MTRLSFDSETGEWVDPEEYAQRKAERHYAKFGDQSADPEAGGRPMVLRDYEPYQSMIDGSIISGRRQHRDHLKAHGCIEVGNERVKQKKIQPDASGALRETLRDYGL